jgi:hypothetical protein
MPTNFPTGVDNFTNPTANDSLNLPSHSTQHANANDAIEAIEGYLLNGGQGLTLVRKQAIGTAVTAVTVSGAFNATYENYLIIFNGVVGSTIDALRLQIGSSVSGYYGANISVAYNSTVVIASNNNNGSSFVLGTVTDTSITTSGVCEIFSPFLTERTGIADRGMDPRTGGSARMASSGYLNDAISHTSVTLKTNSGTMTGGTIYVYGYRAA